MRRLTRRQRIAALVLAALAAVLFTLDMAGGALRTAHDGASGALGALYRGTDSALGPVRRFLQGVPGAAGNEATIRTLQHQNEVLRGELAAAAADRATEAELARLQLAADAGGYSVLPARVIALGPGGGFDWTVTLDEGSSAGVRAGQTVTDGYGLVGRVLHTAQFTSTVLLAADPNSGVGARDLADGQVGVATGQGSAGFSFVPLDPQAVVRVGDQLVTGPAGASSFVAGLAVGTVTAVHSAGNGSVRASVHAASTPTSLDVVGVILGSGGSQGDRAALTPGSAQAQR